MVSYKQGLIYLRYMYLMNVHAGTSVRRTFYLQVDHLLNTFADVYAIAFIFVTMQNHTNVIAF